MSPNVTPSKTLPKSNPPFPKISLNRTEIAIPWKPRSSLNSQSITDFVAKTDSPRSQLFSIGQLMLAPMTATELSSLPYRYPTPEI